MYSVFFHCSSTKFCGEKKSIFGFKDLLFKDYICEYGGWGESDFMKKQICNLNFQDRAKNL